MRPISAPMQSGIDDHIPFAVYLIEVLLTPPLYWATAEIPPWNGHSWLTAGVVIESIDETFASLRLRNDDNSASALALNNLLRDTEFRVYLYYNGDAIEIFRGFGSDARIGAMEVTLALHSHRAINARVPRQRMTGPTFTHLPKLGDVIIWGTDNYKVTY